MPSRYEKNIALQPALMREILARPRTLWMDELRQRRVLFVGIGTSFHAAKIAKWLWRRHVSAEAHAIHSFDFIRIPQPINRDDVVVLLTHSGGKSMTLDAAHMAFKTGAMTVGITGQGSPWTENLTHRLETCEKEDVNVHSKSLTTALAWIIRILGESKVDGAVEKALQVFEAGVPFPEVKASTDLILVGDTVREWVGREVSLKILEACAVRVRPFGLEEFLHGPCLSMGPESLLVAFTDKTEKRWNALREYLKIVEVPLVEVAAPESVPSSAGWLSQLFWGQRFAADICRRLAIDPDVVRGGDPRYKKARALI